MDDEDEFQELFDEEGIDKANLDTAIEAAKGICAEVCEPENLGKLITAIYTRLNEGGTT